MKATINVNVSKQKSGDVITVSNSNGDHTSVYLHGIAPDLTEGLNERDKALNLLSNDVKIFEEKVNSVASILRLLYNSSEDRDGFVHSVLLLLFGKDWLKRSMGEVRSTVAILLGDHLRLSEFRDLMSRLRMIETPKKIGTFSLCSDCGQYHGSDPEDKG